MKGKNVFTQKEIKEIVALIRQRCLSDRNKQKQIRAKMRGMGFYGRDDFGIIDMTEEKFYELIDSRVIMVSDDDDVITPIVQQEEPNSPITSTLKKNSSAALSCDNNSHAPQERDEEYVIDLCDEALNLTASRQHRFPFLVGDTGRQLPVDAYYQKLNIVVEYCERQHTEAVPLFDQRITASGVTRGEQRRIYDERRQEILPQHNIKLVNISYSDFEFDRNKRIKRNHARDLQIVKSKLGL